MAAHCIVVALMWFDETAHSDLAAITEDRQLGGRRGQALAEALAGTTQFQNGKPNKDLPFHIAAHHLLALMLLLRSERNAARQAVSLLLDPRLSKTQALAARLQKLPVDPDDVVITSAEGISLDLEKTLWRSGWSSMLQSFDLIAFLMTCSACQHFAGLLAEMSQAVQTKSRALALADLRKALLEAASLYRDAHLHGVSGDAQRVRRLYRHLAADRTDGAFTSLPALDDERVMTFFESEIAAGERPLFRTIAETALAWHEAARDQRSAAELQEARHLDDPLIAA
jgi:hypothetical protein